MAFEPQRDVPLAPLTTFELGGPARFFHEARTEEALARGLAWAASRGLPVFALGGGSNVVVADEGFDGLVLRVATRGVSVDQGGRRYTAAAGEPWDGFVARTIEDGAAGLECLSGIPGRVGATPIQNVGAYGCEVGARIASVTVHDRESGETVERRPEECGFGYRTSAFKEEPDRSLILRVAFELEPGGTPAIRYPELRRALDGEPRPSIARVREAVLALRRSKSMVLDPGDENRRSAGSFFTNPVVGAADAERVVSLALARGLAKSASEVPVYEAGEGRKKLAAGWLIERAGIHKGLRAGHVGVSTRHALALVHHGGGTTAELVSLARHVRDAVQEAFGVCLRPEPVLLGVAL